MKPQKCFATRRACVSSRQQSWRAVRTKEKNLPAHPHWPWPVFSSHPRSVVHHANLTYPANLSPAPSCLMTPCSITPPPPTTSPTAASLRLFFSLHFPSLSCHLLPPHPSQLTQSLPGQSPCCLLFDPPRISFWVPPRQIYFKHVDPRSLKCGS